MHFICFAEHGGTLYEFDGRKRAPVKHGSCDANNVLQQAAGLIKTKYMALDPAEHRFTILALTMRPSDD